MLLACIDIGTNTTRVLVADAVDGRLTEVLQVRAFTKLGQGVSPSGAISQEKIEEVARVVAEQCALAERAGAAHLKAVATAAIRGAANREELVAAVRRVAGVEVAVLDGNEEARLAFLGATRTLGRTVDGPIGVVDVGGGSSEIAVGTVTGGVHWSASVHIGSCALSEGHADADPPAAAHLEALRGQADAAFARLAVPEVTCAVAVGGSATSLRRFVGPVLDPDSARIALRTLAGAPAADVGRRFDLDPERVRLLPAGILILEAAARSLGQPLHIGRGGLREGVVLDLAGRGA